MIKVAKNPDTQKNSVAKEPISFIYKLCYGETRTCKGAKKLGEAKEPISTAQN